MEKTIKLSQIEEDVEEVEVSQWFVKEGDSIQKGEDLLEILVDKANVVIEAEDSGEIIDLKVEEGEIIPVGTEIAVIEIAD